MVLCLTIISLVYMLFSLIQIIYSFAIADRQERCKLLKNYKKGKFVSVFVAVFPLYIVAYWSSGEGILRTVLNSINSTVELVALSFDLDVLIPMAQKFQLFRVAISLCAVLAIINAFLFSASLLFRRIFNNRKLRYIRRQKRDICVFAGFDKKAESILYSMADNKKNIDILVLSENLNDEFKEKMYILRAAYMPFRASDGLENILKSACGGFSRRHCDLFLSQESEEQNLRLAFEAAKISNALGESICVAGDNKVGLDTYLFSQNARETVYRRIVKMSHGTVHCINQYQMLANDFSLKYPITQMIPQHIDYNHAALKEGTDVRIIMVGFGKVNRQLFKIYTQTNQCMSMQGDTPIIKPLSYYIFDKDKAYEESSFNHTYLHYRNWKRQLSDSSDYFELPPEPASVVFEETDINTCCFQDKLNKAMTTSSKGFNIVIIAMGNDIEAMELAEKIAVNAKDNGCENNTRVFVRVRDSALKEEISHMFDTAPEITPFGDTDSLFTYERIVNPDVEGMAKDRHLCYSLEDKDASQSESEALKQALSKWMFKWENIQRESNIYAALSIRMRLQLLGYDYVKKSHPAPDATQDFLRDYNAQNPIKYKDIFINGKQLVDYKTQYRVDLSPRSVLAETEHSRWNAFYISCGFVPASKGEYKTLGKDELMRRRRHINLTTFKGLDDFDTWRTPDGTPPMQRPDIILYDYQLMDDAAWILSRNGYKIVRREDIPEA